MPADSDGPFGVLFVCTGNICRSPTAEAMARRELASQSHSLATRAKVASRNVRSAAPRS